MYPGINPKLQVSDHESIQRSNQNSKNQSINLPQGKVKMNRYKILNISPRIYACSVSNAAEPFATV